MYHAVVSARKKVSVGLKLLSQNRQTKRTSEVAFVHMLFLLNTKQGVIS